MEALFKYYADLQYASYDAFNEWALCVISLLLILANKVVTVLYNYNYSIQFKSISLLYQKSLTRGPGLLWQKIN